VCVFEYFLFAPCLRRRDGPKPASSCRHQAGPEPLNRCLHLLLSCIKANASEERRALISASVYERGQYKLNFQFPSGVIFFCVFTVRPMRKMNTISFLLFISKIDVFFQDFNQTENHKPGICIGQLTCRHNWIAQWEFSEIFKPEVVEGD